MKQVCLRALCVAMIAGGASPAAAAQQVQTARTEATAGAIGVVPPNDYVIGPDDVLTVVFWRDKDLSSDVVVRPDGKISLPLLNDVHAAGLTPEQLRDEVVKAATRFIEDPTATVIVKAINSRKVFITGNVGKPGTYPLTGSMNVLQLIALAGGLLEYADANEIVIMRSDGGQTQSFDFRYRDVIRQKNVSQNIALKPGDTVVVP